MRLVNLTPHELRVRFHASQYPQPQDFYVLDPAEIPARCTQVSERLPGVVHPDGAHAGVEIPVTRQTFGPVEGLPAPVAGIAYVVSRIVAEACGPRDDVYIPGPALRDADGKVVGCDGLSRL